jgi:hypothetical protein
LPRNLKQNSLILALSRKNEAAMACSIVLRHGLICWSLGVAFAAAASAAIYNEPGEGDLSGTASSPTPFTVVWPDNSIIGTVGAATGDFQDFIRITVPNGLQLNSFVHTSYAGTDQQGFVGFQVGSTFVGSTFEPGSYAGYAHFGTGATNPGVNGGAPTTTVGQNLLPPPYMADNSAGGTAAGATGFTLPLGPGTYTFLIQQAGGNVSYRFDLAVSQLFTVPGDFDFDGDVDGADFVVWQTNFPSAGPGIPPVPGDADGDGDCDGADFVVWQTNFPYTPGPAATPVPEPAAVALAPVSLLGAAFCLRLRRFCRRLR